MGTSNQRLSEFDAVVVGSGPNGLAAAIVLAEAGLRVHVVEGHGQHGGGTRTAELTLPGFRHDVCATAHPTGLLSPLLKRLPLDRYGLEWIQPEIPVAHALDGGRAAVLHRCLATTAAGLGEDEAAYRRYFDTVVQNLQGLAGDLFGPVNRMPRRPLAMSSFGARALLPAGPAARACFRTEEARALFAGNAAHSILPLGRLFTSAVAVMLMGAAHSVGWPFAKGGSQAIADAMVAYLEEIGGSVETGCWVKGMSDLPQAKAYLFDLAPSQLVEIAGERLPRRYRDRLLAFRHGAGVFKLDLALSGPIPWRNLQLREAGTVHLGGPLVEVEESERACWEDRHVDRPFVLLTQPTVFDPSRAPSGRHVVWAYCHSPAGSTLDQSEVILNQIERFAPGARNLVLGRHGMNCAEFERYNPSYVGGDIIGGAGDWRQLFTRPVARWDPYSTPDREIFLCSASTPPGGGVHGMCGASAARSVLRKVFQR